MSTLTDKITEALAAEGFDNSGENPHSWRCEYYDDYCDCVEQAVKALVAVVVEWLAVDAPEMLTGGGALLSGRTAVRALAAEAMKGASQ